LRDVDATYLLKSNVQPGEIQNVFEIVSMHPAISRLGLSHNKTLGASGAEAIAEALKSMHFLGDEDKVSLAEEGSDQQCNLNNTSDQLTELFFNECAFQESGLNALAEALILTSVEKLGLNQNNFGNEGCSHVPKLLNSSVWGSLQVLGLMKNGIGNSGACQIARGLDLNSTLLRLYLNENEIGDEGALALAQALRKHRSMVRLGLTFNKIEDTGAYALMGVVQEKDSQTFEKLCIFGNCFSEEAQSALSSVSNIYATKKSRRKIIGKRCS